MLAWGSAFANANVRHAQGCVDDGDAAVAVEQAGRARQQLEHLVALLPSKSSVHLCGSSVTQGFLTQVSDLDFVLCSAAEERSIATREVQLQQVEQVHRHLHRFLPTYMKRACVAMRTARTPVVRFGFTHAPPTKVRISQSINTEEDALRPARLVNSAADDSPTERMASVAPAVAASKFRRLSDADSITARSVLLHFRGMVVEKSQVADVLRDAKIDASVTHVEHNVSNVLKHPGGFDAPTSVAEDHNMGMQAHTAMEAQRNESTLVTVVGATPVDALRVFACFPDGSLVPRSKRDLVTADLLDRCCVPELLRFQFDISFAGYSVPNSYLLRHYLLGSTAPAWAGHGAAALKRWAKATHVSNAPLGLLSPYAVTIMWAYFLLATHQVPWLDPGSVPVPAALPHAAPPLVATLPTLTDEQKIQLAENMAAFFLFYRDVSGDTGSNVAGGRFDGSQEVVSLSRSRRSRRFDVGWAAADAATGPPPGFLLCIEDPYELVGEGGLNLGRHVNAAKLSFLGAKFTAAVRQMVEGSPDDSDDAGLLGRSVDAVPQLDE